MRKKVRTSARRPTEKKAVKKRPIRRRYYGLWHAARRVEVQDVKPAHKKACCVCGERPEERRLVVAEGVARAKKSSVYCGGCGWRWIRERINEAERAQARLGGADACIRAQPG